MKQLQDCKNTADLNSTQSAAPSSFWAAFFHLILVIFKIIDYVYKNLQMFEECGNSKNGWFHRSRADLIPSSNFFLESTSYNSLHGFCNYP